MENTTKSNDHDNEIGIRDKQMYKSRKRLFSIKFCVHENGKIIKLKILKN